MRNTNRKTPDALLDPLTGAQHAMSWEHHAIHEGFAFSSSYSNDLPGGEQKAVEIRVPAHVELHLKQIAIWTTASEVVVTLLENPTIGNPSITPLPVVNRNRAQDFQDVQSVVAVLLDPTSISGGNELFQVSIGAGGTGISAGASTGSEDREWLLGDKDTDSVYVLEMENQDVQAKRISWALFWYEIDERD
jgi:hypothetical protein